MEKKFRVTWNIKLYLPTNTKWNFWQNISQTEIIRHGNSALQYLVYTLRLHVVRLKETSWLSEEFVITDITQTYNNIHFYRLIFHSFWNYCQTSEILTLSFLRLVRFKAARMKMADCGKQKKSTLKVQVILAKFHQFHKQLLFNIALCFSMAFRP